MHGGAYLHPFIPLCSKMCEMEVSLERSAAPETVIFTRAGPRLRGPSSTAPVKSKRPVFKAGGGLTKIIAFIITLLVTAAVTGIQAAAAPATGTLNDIVTTLFGEDTQTVDIIILLTILTVLPSIVLMLTGFTRILIVLSFMRNALGMQQTPPNQVLVGLALFLTLFVMGPVITEVYNEAYIPYTRQEINQEEFIERAMTPTRKFMLDQTYESDMNFFISMSREQYEDQDAVPNRVVIPAFMTSEIKRAFEIGFFIYIPFIVIDMVVASTLMAMGMMMLPPAMISLPFKVLLFVLVDGWQLVMGSLIKSFRFVGG